MARLNQDPKRVRRRRIAAGMTQAELGELAGISKSYVSMIECGTAGASAHALAGLAAGLGCAAEDLMRPTRARKAPAA